MNDPIVEAYIDGRRNKWGSKFHTYLARPPFFIGIISMLMFFDFGFSTGGTIAYVIIMYFCRDFLYSFQETSAMGNLIGGLLLSGLKYDSSITNLAGQNPAFYKYQWALFIIGPALGADLYIIPTLKIRDNNKAKAQIEKELAECHKATTASEQEQ